MKAIKYFVFGVILVLVIAFSALNAEAVAINYYFGQLNMPMALLLVIVFVIAVVVTSLLFLGKMINLRMKIRSLEKSYNNAQKQQQ